MIKNFRQHAANERTFLAWIRSSVNVFGFGFLIEKFNLLSSSQHHTIHKALPIVANIIGIGLMILSIIILVIAIKRYISINKYIDDEKSKNILYHKGNKLTMFGLTFFMILLAFAMIAYIILLVVQSA